MITVKRESDLERQEWVFQYNQTRRALTLLRWEQNTRPSARHRFRRLRAWWLGYREDAPVVPDDILDEARRQFVETLKVEW